MPVPLPRKYGLGALAVCAAAVCAIALLTNGGPARAADPTRAEDQFSVLSAPSSASDVDLFGSGVGRRLAEQSARLQDIVSPQSPYTPDAASSRTRIDASGDEPRAIGVASAANGGVCLASRTSSGPLSVVCSSVGEAATKALVSMSRPAPGLGVDPDDWNVAALLPDGVKSVTFTTGTEAPVEVPVLANTVVRTVRRPTTLSFTSPLGGPQDISVTPKDAR